MSFNGSGTFVINSTGQPVSANTLIEAFVFNAFTADVATGLSTAITKDGQTTVTANLPMAGYRLTGLGAGSANGHSLRYEQLFSTSAVTLLGALNWVKGADIASATTINLTTATGNAVHVTGTTQIDAVTLGSGMWRMVIFDGALTLAHSATANNLPGGANITTAANDRALYWSDGTTVYCAAYNKASGKATVAPAVGDVTGLGTGVATALAVNVGSAGAPVVNGGALGTPSSGDVSNCTGFPTAIFSVAYDSGNQTISSAGLLTLAHGLGAAPKIIQCFAKCTTAEYNYSIGDLVAVSGAGSQYTGAGGVSTGFAVIPDATNISIRFGAETEPVTAPNKTTGVLQSLTTTSWVLIVRAYA